MEFVATTGEWVATASEDGTAAIWDLREGKSPRMQVVARHSGSVVYAGFTPDRDAVVTVSMDGTAGTWGLPDRSDIAPTIRFGRDVSAGNLSTDGTLVAVGFVDGSVAVWRR